MILFYILIAIFVVGFLIVQFGGWDFEDIGKAMETISVFICALALLAIPMNRMEVHSNIYAFAAVAETVRTAHEHSDTLEGAAFRLKIAESNEWLARAKYWRTTTFHIYIPVEIDALEPIQ